MTGPVAVWRCSLLMFIIQLFFEICICLANGIERNLSCLDACFLDLQSFFVKNHLFWMNMFINSKGKRQPREGTSKSPPENKNTQRGRKEMSMHGWSLLSAKASPRNNFVAKNMANLKGCEQKTKVYIVFDWSHS